jgi:hypothetical protein
VNLFHKEYGRDLLENGQMLGWPGHTMQINESLLSKAKHTQNNHARPVQEQWVFGAYDTKDKVGWIQLVNSGDADIFQPTIQLWCRPGTIIVSDGWAAYRGLGDLGFEYHVVVHEQPFVDPETGLHKQC